MAPGPLTPAPDGAPAVALPSSQRAPAPRRFGLWLSGLLGPRRSPLPLAYLAQPGAKRAVQSVAGGVAMQDAILCRVLGRYKMLVDPADRGFAPHLVLDGYWEWWTTTFLARHLRQGQHVAEAGAGFGYFTLLMADLIGPAGSLTAFEPNPRAADLLQHNLDLNGFGGRVRLHRNAVGASAAPAVALQVPAHAPLAAALREGMASLGPGQTVHSVARLALDRLAEQRLDWLKLDLPGSAEALWQGMQGLLDRQPGTQVLMGFDPARARAPANLVERIGQRFPLRAVDPDGRARRTDTATLLAGGTRLLYLAPR